ncbi:DNA/RNA non-specific endonuclease [Streptomyces sp. NPDC001634]|uniref:DNA/RNA non-specific endonuclease n=1 Tax=Streptomyces sp. NPDC001634 TaxID=3154390 RepID=UPI00331D38A3
MAGSTPILVHNTKGCEADPTWGGSVQFAGPDALGRPQGVSAAISRPMIGEGTPADADIRPPGFTGGRPIGDQARGHLLGRQLGGSGDIPENLVTLLQNPVNTPIMSGFERQVRLAVEGGQFVQYSVTPIYEGSNLVPRAVTLSAYGSGDFSLNVSILNGR